MNDYKELIQALKCCGSNPVSLCDECPYQSNEEKCWNIDIEAANTIEDIIKTNKKDVVKAWNRRINDTADAVHCKDCKWSRERNEKEKIYLVDGVVICTNPEVSEDCWSAVWETELCACGEPKK